MNEVTRFCNQYQANEEFRSFAKPYQMLAEVWENCQQPDVLLWMLDCSPKRPHNRLRAFTSWLLE